MAASFADPTASDLARIDVVAHGSSVRLVVTGEIDSSTAPALGRSVEGVLADPPGSLTVDLCGVSFLDSAGLSVLATAHRLAREDGVALRVLAASRAVVRPLQITGLWQLLGAEQVTPGADVEGVA
ncbi:STAS domain-containing protein [Blastococcus sp. SYSU D01042]